MTAHLTSRAHLLTLDEGGIIADLLDDDDFDGLEDHLREQGHHAEAEQIAYQNYVDSAILYGIDPRSFDHWRTSHTD